MIDEKKYARFDQVIFILNVEMIPHPLACDSVLLKFSKTFGNHTSISNCLIRTKLTGVSLVGLRLRTKFDYLLQLRIEGCLRIATPLRGYKLPYACLFILSSACPTPTKIATTNTRHLKNHCMVERGTYPDRTKPIGMNAAASASRFSTPNLSTSHRPHSRKHVSQTLVLHQHYLS
jgi:hypothetical protein